MQEPSLYSMAQASAEGYRFLLVPSFGPPQAVRIQKTANGYVLTFKQLTADALRGGKLVASHERPLTAAEAKAVMEGVERISFWKLPLHPGGEHVGTDGDQWILEGVRDSTYHVVDWWSPSYKLDFGKFCMSLLKFAEQ